MANSVLARLAALATAVSMLVLLAGCGPKGGSEAVGSGSPSRAVSSSNTLTMTVVPYEAADKLNEDYGGMADYLAKRAGRKQGRFVPVTEYAGVIAALKSDQVDVAYLSPLPYAIASGQMKLAPLAMPYVKGKLDYHGILFVRADSPIKTVADLKGKTIAFSDPTSTSGYLLPRRLLEKSGILPQLKNTYSAGDGTTVLKAVETGAADCGASYDQVFTVGYKGHPEKMKLMRVIAQTEEIPNGLYVARGDLPADEIEKLRKAFLDMNSDPEGRKVMLKAPNDKEVPVDDKLFDGVRETAKAEGIGIGALDKRK